MVRKPRCSSRSWVAGPTPKMNPTGLSASIARASSWSSAAKPRGLSRSEAILARNLLQDRPTETVMPMSRSTSRAKRASTFAGIMPWTRWVPDRSRNASSIDSGSTSGVSACMAWRTSRPTRTYFAMSGGITVA